MKNQDIIEKEKKAINFIKKNCVNFSKIKLAFSGGKDSVVIYNLTKKSGILAEAIYQNTTIDPPGTIKFIKENFTDVKIQMPEKSFYKLVEDKGLPNRWQRWCCSYLKENTNNGYDLVITGVRRAESFKRSSYTKIAQRGTIVELRPIIEWSDDDVWNYIGYYNLPVIKYYKAPYNYTRHGCVMCPLASGRQMIQEARDFPRYAKAMIKAIRKFRKKKAHLKFVQSFTDEYEMFYLFLLQKLNGHGRELMRDNIFKLDPKKQLEKLLKIKL